MLIQIVKIMHIVQLKGMYFQRVLVELMQVVIVD